MKLLAPKYFNDFKCIADKCSHSCCIGWEIDVDEDTMEKYRALSHPYAKGVLDSIDIENTPHFKLCEGERCPHLNEKGLCNIITNLGEELLCDICREHPRFYLFSPTFTEVGLGMACEEACRIILSSCEYDTFVELEGGSTAAEESGFDPIEHRKGLFEILKSPRPYKDKLLTIYSAYGINLSAINQERVDELLGGLEYLDSKHKKLFACLSLTIDTPPHLEPILERALAYFIYRHCTEALDEGELVCALGFALFCERLLCSVTQKTGDPYLSARIISEELEYSEDNTEKIKELFI